MCEYKMLLKIKQVYHILFILFLILFLVVVRALFLLRRIVQI
jgi:hypothetical protein